MTERSVPDDAMLVRFLDNEASDDERAQVEAAAAADAGVSDRLAQLRTRSQAAAGMLAADDVPVPASLQSFDAVRARAPAPESSRWLRAAVLLAGLGLASLAVPPVRAWLLDATGLVDGERAGGAVAAAPAVAVDTVVISFDAPPEFLIELETAQRDGRLIVRIADVEQASAELRTSGGTESFFVIPEGIQIVNGDVSTAEYEITLPRTVRDVRIRIPGREDVAYTAAESDQRIFELDQ
jgi:hypothetical protein